MKIPPHVSQFPVYFYRFYFLFCYKNKNMLCASADGVVIFVKNNVFLFFHFNLDKLRTPVLTFHANEITFTWI